MGSSAKTGKKFFRGSPEHFLDKNAIWDRTPPNLHINCSLHVWGRVQGSQIFKRNSIISIRSKVMAFLLILLSPHGPCCPHVIPVIPTSSPCHPRCPHRPHVVPISPRRSPCGLHMLSPSSPRCPHHPHVVPIAPRRSPCGLHGLWSPHVVPIIPVVPTSSRRSPHHLQPPRYPLHPSPTPPGGGGGPESVKMQ